MTPFFDIHISHKFETGFPLEVQVSSTSSAIAFVGPSGCGKTSIIHAIAGILPVDKAQVRVGEKTLTGRAPWDRGVGLVDQDAMLFPLLDVRANLCFGAERGGASIALDDVLELLEIWHLLDRKVRHLSGGERQRVALGRALMSAPELLLLDEPFASLDAPRRQRMVARLKEVRETWSLPMVLVSHHLEAIDPLVDEVFHLNEGQRV